MLKERMRFNNSLHILSLNNCTINDEIAKVIFELLTHNMHLKKLYLAKNNITIESI